MEKNAIILDKFVNEFSKEFWEAVYTYFSGENRGNAYQRWYLVTEKEMEDYEGDFLIINKQLLEKGFTQEDYLFFDNTW